MRQAVALADADPFRPPVAAAAVEMDDRPLSVLERGARVGEHAVAAVDDRRQVGLVCGDGELREVRDPQHVRTLGVESPVRQVPGALVGSPLYELLCRGHQAMPGHEPHDPFCRHRYPHALRLQVEPLVSIPAFAVPGAPRARVPAAARPCWDVSWRELVVVRAARDADHGQQAFRGWSGFPGLRPAFSQQLQRSPADRDLDVELLLFPPLPFAAPSSYLGHLRPQREHLSAAFRHCTRTTSAGAGRNGESSTDTSSTTMPLTFSNRLN